MQKPQQLQLHTAHTEQSGHYVCIMRDRNGWVSVSMTAWQQKCGGPQGKNLLHVYNADTIKKILTQSKLFDSARAKYLFLRRGKDTTLARLA